MHDEIITITYERTHPLYGRVSQKVLISPDVIDDYKTIPGMVFDKAFRKAKEDVLAEIKRKWKPCGPVNIKSGECGEVTLEFESNPGID